MESAPANAQLLNGATLWFTGLSGAGKSTLSIKLKEILDQYFGDSNKVFILDGDVIRRGLNKDLGFTAEARAENIRRISEVSKLFSMSNQLCITAFISPYEKDRDAARQIHKDAGIPFYECYINSPLEVCEARDVKGLYKKARAGEIPNFTGVSDPFEAPANPEINVKTSEQTVEESAQYVINFLKQNKLIGTPSCDTGKSIIDSTASAPADLKVLDLDLEHLQYLQTISEGWAHPLEGFMNEMQLLEVTQMKTLTDKSGHKHLFSVPITCPATTEQMEALKDAKQIGLKCSAVSDEVFAVVDEPTFFANRKEEICTRTYGTFSLNHPRVERAMAEGDWLLSGAKTTFLKKITYNDGLDKFRLTPEEIKDKIAELKADAVYAFQVRNPLHNGHVLLLKDCREQLLKQGYKNPILLLHPLGGWTKEDDVPTDTRMFQHQALLEDGTLPKEHCILALWPSPMYYAGPTEVMWHCSSRAAAGISHFITGRDPAGMKHPDKDCDLYDAWHGQKLLMHVKSMINNVEVMPFKVAAYNKATQNMEFFNPAKKDDFDFISGSRMRAMAKNSEEPPAGFMSPAGWKVLAEYYRNLKE